MKKNGIHDQWENHPTFGEAQGYIYQMRLPNALTDDYALFTTGLFRGCARNCAHPVVSAYALPLTKTTQISVSTSENPHFSNEINFFVL